MAKITSKELRDAAKDAAIRIADRNKDGRVDTEDARLTARAWEERFPLLALVFVWGAGFILGLWVRGFFC